MNTSDEQQLRRILGLNGLEETLAALKRQANWHRAVSANLGHAESVKQWERAITKLDTLEKQP